VIQLKSENLKVINKYKAVESITLKLSTFNFGLVL